MVLQGRAGASVSPAMALGQRLERAEVGCMRWSWECEEGEDGEVGGRGRRGGHCYWVKVTKPVLRDQSCRPRKGCDQNHEERLALGPKKKASVLQNQRQLRRLEASRKL